VGAAPAVASGTTFMNEVDIPGADKAKIFYATAGHAFRLRKAELIKPFAAAC
jgi:hypothetical protein